MGWRTEWVVAIVVMKLVALQAQETPPPPPSSGGAIALKECPWECGGVSIPYPFGIGENCSYPSSYNGFQVQCTRNKPMLRDRLGEFNYEVSDISLSDSTVRVSTTTPAICNSSWIYKPLWNGYNLRLAPSANVFAVLGCNVLAFFRGYAYTNEDYVDASSGYNYRFVNRTVGCVPTCFASEGVPRTKQVEMEVCNNGCCQTPVDIPARSYETVVRGIDNADLTTISNVKNCHYAFVVEKGKLNFSGAKDTVRPRDSIKSIFLGEWSLGNDRVKTCEDALKNRSTYACASSNSECVNSTYWGYTCRCKKGYAGNPYLSDGCRDINECINSHICGNDSICFNIPGSYICYSPMLSKKSGKLGIAMGLGIAASLFLLLATLALCYRRWRKQTRKRTRERHFHRNRDMLQQQLLLYPSGDEKMNPLINYFTLTDIKKATNNFDRSHIVGQGGHGTVYKGLIDLRVVAIKKSNLIVQSDVEGFINEIILLSQISHKNVVKLIGCCFEAEVPLLVYEFISNGTLADHLHIWKRDEPLSWEDRLRIAIEISGALSHLHSSARISIFHRDIKSSNILLDDKLTAKISDFGASKFIEMDHTHASTIIQGTLGYVDPEYVHTGHLTEKSDVYSLGVILVELVTGEKPTSKTKFQEEGNLIRHFIWAFEENKLFQVVEASIVEDNNREEIATVARLAVDCLKLIGTERPRMKEVEITLEGLKKSKVQKKLKAVSSKYEQKEVENISHHSSSYPRSESPKQSVISTWKSS